MHLLQYRYLKKYDTTSTLLDMDNFGLIADRHNHLANIKFNRTALRPPAE
jgi:hypothetical protein